MLFSASIPFHRQTCSCFSLTCLISSPLLIFNLVLIFLSLIFLRTLSSSLSHTCKTITALPTASHPSLSMCSNCFHYQFKKITIFLENNFSHIFSLFRKTLFKIQTWRDFLITFLTLISSAFPFWCYNLVPNYFNYLSFIETFFLVHYMVNYAKYFTAFKKNVHSELAGVIFSVYKLSLLNLLFR